MVQLAVLSWEQEPRLVYQTQLEYEESAGDSCPNSNFLKGVKWSPDGACCLTASDDKWLRVFDLPRDAMTRVSGGGEQQQQQQQQQQEEEEQQQQQEEGERRAGPAAAPTPARQQAGASGSGRPAGDTLRSALRVHAGESVYDYAWFSGMSTADPASCCFASTTRGHPIHLWDACSGQLRASYRAHDDADDPTAAYSLAFSPDGAKLVGGYPKCLRIFDVSRPGRECERVLTQRRKKEGSMAGIVSCIAFNPPSSDLLAAGAYSGSIALFDARSHEQLLLLEGHKGGVTQVLFSRDGMYLYSGARRDARVLCWDVRVTAAPLYEMARDTATTNQRVQISIDPCNRHLATGGCDGVLRVFDLRDGSEAGSFHAAPDTVSGVDIHPVMGLPLLATASGHRRYPLAPSDDEGEGPAAGEGGAGSSGGEGEAARSAKRRRHVKAGSSDRSGSGGGGDWGFAAGCNALRLWRVNMGWEEVECEEGDAEAAAAAAADGGEGGEGAAAAGTQQPNGAEGMETEHAADGEPAGGLPYVKV